MTNSNELKVTIMQTKLVRDIDYVTGLLRGREQDMIVFAEYAPTDMSLPLTRMVEDIDASPTLDLFKRIAKKTNSIAVSTWIIRDVDGKLYNRLFAVRPDGTYETCDKMHPPPAGVEAYLARGRKGLMLELKGWKILFTVCNDIRFPVYQRNTRENRYDVMVNCALSPQEMSHTIEPVVKTRALENIIYCLCANLVGKNGDFNFIGQSIAVDYKGDVIGTCPDGKEAATTVILKKDELEAFRAGFPNLDLADDFKLL